MFYFYLKVYKIIFRCIKKKLLHNQNPKNTWTYKRNNNRPPNNNLRS